MYFIVLVKAFVHIIQSSIKSEEKIQSLETKQDSMQKGHLLVRADRKNAKILLEDILYIESLSDYVKIILKDKPIIITKEKISNIEEKLSKPFLRIHRSFIVNTNEISSFSSESIEINSVELPISRSYKKAALQFLKGEKH